MCCVVECRNCLTENISFAAPLAMPCCQILANHISALLHVRDKAETNLLKFHVYLFVPFQANSKGKNAQARSLRSGRKPLSADLDQYVKDVLDDLRARGHVVTDDDLQSSALRYARQHRMQVSLKISFVVTRSASSYALSYRYIFAS